MLRNIFMLLVFLFLLSCSNNSDIFRSDVMSSNKSAAGNFCKEGCIWSTWAVTMGVQQKETQCHSGPCACVKEGDIYSLCQFEKEVDIGILGQVSEETQTDVKYDNDTGNRIASEAYFEATSRNTVGWCYNAVADAVERITGAFLWGSSAYQAIDQFANHSSFFEVYNRDLRYLPAGAIVIWERGSSPHGHISVSLGDGREASDHVAAQMTYHYGGGKSRVFLPKLILQ